MAKIKTGQSFEILPLMPLRGMILFPHATMDLDVGRELSIKAVERAMAQDQRIFVYMQRLLHVIPPWVTILSYGATGICQVTMTQSRPCADAEREKSQISG